MAAAKPSHRPRVRFCRVFCAADGRAKPPAAIKRSWTCRALGRRLANGRAEAKPSPPHTKLRIPASPRVRLEQQRMPKGSQLAVRTRGEASIRFAAAKPPAAGIRFAAAKSQLTELSPASPVDLGVGRAKPTASPCAPAKLRLPASLDLLSSEAGSVNLRLELLFSGKRDSNARPFPWQGDALPLSYTRIFFINLRITRGWCRLRVG